MIKYIKIKNEFTDAQTKNMHIKQTLLLYYYITSDAHLRVPGGC